MIYYLILTFLFLVFIAWREINYRKSKKDLLNRIMSRDYTEYSINNFTDDKKTKKLELNKHEIEERAIEKEYGVNMEV